MLPIVTVQHTGLARYVLVRVVDWMWCMTDLYTMRGAGPILPYLLTEVLLAHEYS